MSAQSEPCSAVREKRVCRSHDHLRNFYSRPLVRLESYYISIAEDMRFAKKSGKSHAKQRNIVKYENFERIQPTYNVDARVRIFLHRAAFFDFHATCTTFLASGSITGPKNHSRRCGDEPMKLAVTTKAIPRRNFIVL